MLFCNIEKECDVERIMNLCFSLYKSCKNQDFYVAKNTSTEILLFMSQTFSMLKHSQIQKIHGKINRVPTFFYVKKAGG